MEKDLSGEIFSWIKSILLALIIAFLVRAFLFEPTTVFGESMSPTFHDQDKVIVLKTTEIERADMVVFEAPDADEYYIKRVIGLPGDHVEMKDDVLYINGVEVAEPYLHDNRERSPLEILTGDFTLEELTGEERVPENCFFVLGDNRLYSKDSRYFGFISEEDILGEVKFRYFPIAKIGLPQ